jgi:hypothetical protein
VRFVRKKKDLKDLRDEKDIKVGRNDDRVPHHNNFRVRPCCWALFFLREKIVWKKDQKDLRDQRDIKVGSNDC